jgi:hypothetical protein
MSYLEHAFNTVADNARKPDVCFVCLMERTCEYGGPEEGGWWNHDAYCVAYREYATREAAELAKEQIEALATELTDESRREHGNHCLRQMEWLDARGLEADWLTEDDGPSEFYIAVCDIVPAPPQPCRQYS